MAIYNTSMSYSTLPHLMLCKHAITNGLALQVFIQEHKACEVSLTTHCLTSFITSLPFLLLLPCLVTIVIIPLCGLNSTGDNDVILSCSAVAVAWEPLALSHNHPSRACIRLRHASMHAMHTCYYSLVCQLSFMDRAPTAATQFARTFKGKAV